MPSKAPPERCRLCGSDAIHEWGRKHGQQFVDREFTFWRCRHCDLRFVDPVTGPEIYDEAYYTGRGLDPLVNYEAEYLDYRGTPRLEEFQGLAAVAASYFAEVSDAVDPPPVAPLTWLDYGCGAGGLMKFLIDQGSLPIGSTGVPLVVSGFDVGSFADRLRRRDGLNVHTPESLARLAPGSFDVISLIEVIEHVERPLDVLHAVRRLLKPGGLLLLTTGNLASPLARWQGVRFAYCMPEIHITLWTPRSLTAAYALVGLLPYLVRCRGSLRFKIRKNLERFAALQFTERLWLSPPAVAALDAMFGVSAMPMAINPLDRAKG